MAYIAVTAFENNMYAWTVLGDNYEVLNAGQTSVVEFGMLVRTNNLTPVNFSLARDNSIKMDCGDFARFSKLGSAVVVAEIKTRGGKSIGYKLLSCNQRQVVNLKTEDIIARDAQYGENEHFLQNGIIRNKTVNCFPRHPFPEVIMERSSKKRTKKPKSEPVVKHEPPKTEKPKKSFNDNQKTELKMCKQNGIDPSLIKNPDLNQQQMRVLWVSKSKGALAEEFNDPRLSTDAMKFYADRLYDKQTVKDCKQMLEHPELSPAELAELYQCACEGIDYTDLIGKSATDIGVEREMASRKYWGSSSLFDTDYYAKAMNVAMKMKGL